MNKKSSSNYYNNINLPNNLKFRPHSKSNDLISQTEVVGLLPSSFGDEGSAIPSLVSPAHRALKNRSSQKPKQKHDRKKRRSSRHRGKNILSATLHVITVYLNQMKYVDKIATKT